MHELSIARALVQLTKQYRPQDLHVRGIHVQAGPLRAIDPGALQWAWTAATIGTEFQHTVLHLQLLPWALHCPACDRRWEAASLDEACACGSRGGIPAGGDELLLKSLDIEPSSAASTQRQRSEAS